MTQNEWLNFGGFLVSFAFFILILKIGYDLLIGNPRREGKIAAKEMERRLLYQALDFQDAKEMVNSMPNDESPYARIKRNVLEEMRQKLKDSWGEE